MDYGITEFTYKDLKVTRIVHPWLNPDDYVSLEKYNQYVSYFKDNRLFALIPKYEEWVSSIKNNRILNGVTCLVILETKDDTIVGLSCVDNDTFAKDSLNNSFFTQAGDSNFAINLPPVYPKYLNIMLDVLPNVLISNYLDIYDSKCGYKKEDSYGFYIPRTFADYINCLNKYNKQECNRILRKNTELRFVKFDGSISELYKEDLFVRSYYSNLNRWTLSSVENPLNTITHINNLINISDPIIFTVYNEYDDVIAYNLGEIRGNAYVDIICVPVDYEQYKKLNIGIWVIYKVIEYLCGRIPFYHLDVGGTYKKKFIPQEIGYNVNHYKKLISYSDYTSVNPEFLTSVEYYQNRLNPPIHIKEVGWIMDKEALNIYIDDMCDNKIKEELNIQHINLDDFVTLYPYMYPLSPTDEMAHLTENDLFDNFEMLYDILNEEDSNPGTQFFIVGRNISLSPFGFISYQIMESGVAYITNICIQKELRGHSLGLQFLINSFDVISKYHKDAVSKVALHVSKSNPAKEMYDRVDKISDIQVNAYGPIYGHYDYEGSCNSNAYKESVAYYYEFCLD